MCVKQNSFELHQSKVKYEAAEWTFYLKLKSFFLHCKTTVNQFSGLGRSWGQRTLVMQRRPWEHGLNSGLTEAMPDIRQGNRTLWVTTGTLNHLIWSYTDLSITRHHTSSGVCSTSCKQTLHNGWNENKGSGFFHFLIKYIFHNQCLLMICDLSLLLPLSHTNTHTHKQTNKPPPQYYLIWTTVDLL